MDAHALTTHHAWTVGARPVEHDELDLSCLVCGAFGHDVDVLVVSPDQRFRICDRCVEMAQGVVKEKRAERLQ